MSIRNQILRVRVSEEERDRIKMNAGEERKVSAFVRALALGEKPPRQKPTPPCDPELVRELSRLGNNLNQLARTANEQRKSGFDADTAQLLGRLTVMQSDLEAIRERYTR